MAKTPYEIRLDLLTMAKDMLDKQYEAASNMAWKAFEKASEDNKDMYKSFDQYIPKMFHPDEVISQAEKLQEFINRKD
jgi:methionine synthase II (cobalamin-independent)